MSVPKPGKRLIITRHANKRLQERGFTAAEVKEKFARARKIHTVYDDSGFTRFINKRLMYITKERRDDYLLITVFRTSRFAAKKWIKSYI